MREKGVKFVICTGRPLKLVKSFLKELNTEDLEDEYTICNSGITIYENKNEKLIYFKGIDYETAQLVLEFGKRFKDISISFSTFDGTFAFKNEAEKEEKEEAGKKHRGRKMIGFKHNYIKSLEEIKNSQIIIILINTKDPESLLNVINEINNDEDSSFFENDEGEEIEEVKLFY
jgi:hydroxymethylpyrimidine pyrophosphatase-like HAD family hydrolase